MTNVDSERLVTFIQSDFSEQQYQINITDKWFQIKFETCSNGPKTKTIFVVNKIKFASSVISTFAWV